MFVPSHAEPTEDISELAQYNIDKVHEYAHNIYFESASMILVLVSLGKYLEAKSDKGFKAKLKLEEGTLYEVKVDDAIYNGNPVTLDVSEKFTFQPLKVE